MADTPIPAGLHPGPLVHDIISAGTAHRAHSIFHGHIQGNQLDVRRCDREFWEHTPIPDPRPETHTFHLPVGEATVTLQDVEVLWGLHIDGPPVIGVDTYRSIQEWGAICEELLGFSPAVGYFDGQRLKLGCLARVLDTELPADASNAECRQRTRIYILLILGGHLLSDKSGNKVPLLYLPLLRDLETVGQYSWGSACLATLYRSLCDATHPAKSAIAGPLVLLQLWIWEHIPTMRPDRIAPLEHYPDPYAARCAFRTHLGFFNGI
ncbi:unnamed protein product [Coffea canephora]|uniref:Aminotransferase-like plant mobile domain-containing protein n=1 Tax=Coffea canephora TaxID=49390 RepID=A0A068VAB0_COFCA|nr:unnamed protein product [Coffea canephora]